LELTPFACRLGSILDVTRKRGWSVRGVGEAVNVIVLVAWLDWLALLVAVKW
jgi:hypothetical protein